MDQELFTKFVLNLYMLLVDESTAVLKKVIQSTTQLYTLFLQVCLYIIWPCKLVAVVIKNMAVYAVGLCHN